MSARDTTRRDGSLGGTWGGGAAMSDHARVLVVEASQELAENQLELLGTLGYRADRASSAAEARRLLRAHRYECVLLDAALPDADSAALVGELRSLDPGLRIVVTAALLDGGAAERIQHAGATSVLRTFETQGFVDELDRVLTPEHSNDAGDRSRRYARRGHRQAPSDLR